MALGSSVGPVAVEATQINVTLAAGGPLDTNMAPGGAQTQAAARASVVTGVMTSTQTDAATGPRTQT